MDHPVKVLYSFLWIGDWCELFFIQPLDRLLVLPQVNLCPHKDDGLIGTVVTHLWIPFGTDVVKGGRARQGEAYQEDILLTMNSDQLDGVPYHNYH